MNIKVNKAFLTYVGIKRDKSIPKSEQFTVEITGDELTRIKTFPFPVTFAGKVVESGNKSKQEINKEANNFCNPFYYFHNYHHAGWKIVTCICEGSFHHDDCPMKVK